MSSQRLNDRYVRRIRRLTGLGESVIRAWAHGGYVHDFVTVDHRHAWFDIRTTEWGWITEPVHYTSCRDLFPDLP